MRFNSTSGRIKQIASEIQTTNLLLLISLTTSKQQEELTIKKLGHIRMWADRKKDQDLSDRICSLIELIKGSSPHK